ncbi:MAG: apolipoprotein N-acyltransferase [Spirochaetes bacterium GWB1_59_5]|nr:MAG: apolipoprotein N-acyltransferase [Spirochaetes bacterium GWB1_59_5]
MGALSSVLLALALPNELYSWGSPALGLIALAPLFVALASTNSFREAFLVGAIFGGLAHGLSSYWLWFFKDFRFWTLGTSSIAYMAVYGCIGMYLRGALKRTGIVRTLVFAMAWAVIEWGKSSGFLGYPWGLVAYSWNTVLPATQIAESTGVYGLSFALAFVSASIGEILAPQPVRLRSPWDKTAERPMLSRLRFILPPRPSYEGTRFLAAGHLVVSAVLLLAITGYGLIALDRPRTARGFVDAVLVQQNVDSWTGSESENLGVSIALARKAIAESDIAPDLVLFSETTLRRPWNGFERFYAKTPGKDPLARFIADSGAYLFTGAPEILDYETYEATNSVILINPQGKQTGTYAKIHPVPFAEAIPFWEYDPFRKFIQEVVGLESGWVMGTERVVFQLPTKSAGIVRFSAPICFEDAVATLCREFIQEGADILVNLTNDSWSKTDSAEIQHFVAARFRSIELRRTLVRSTNGGVSAIVGPDGRILEMLPLFQSRSRMVRIPVHVDEITPYLMYGDWFAFSLACILAAMAIILFIDDSKTKKEPV